VHVDVTKRWTVRFLREPADGWPDVPCDLAAGFAVFAPQSVTVSVIDDEKRIPAAISVTARGLYPAAMADLEKTWALGKNSEAPDWVQEIARKAVLHVRALEKKWS
jgi:hypothetical protein